MSKKTVLTEEEKAARRKKRRIFNIFLYTFSALLIVGGIIIILRDQTSLFSRNSADPPEATFPPVELNTPEPMTTAAPADPNQTEPPPTDTPEPTATPAPIAPVSISFVDHGIDVAVIPVGLNDKGQMDAVPAYDIAGWFELGAAPNQPGNCIIAGHNRYGGQLGLFSILHDGLREGDRITLKLEDGSYRFYFVESIENYYYYDVPDYVMGQGDDTRLTLITCMGDYDHSIHMSRTRAIAICRLAG